jgi:hypothetical protein
MTTTAGTMINDALMEIGVLAEGDTPTAAMSDSALRALNRICDMMSNDQSFAYTPSLISIALTGQSSVTVGPTGAIVSDRPISIDTAWSDRGGISYPCQVTDNQKFDAIVFKAAAGFNPQVIWYEPTMGNGIIHIWPVSTGCTLNMRILNSVTSFSNLATVLVMPPGYEEYFVKTLAVNIAPQYPAGVLSYLTIKAAKKAWTYISRTNNLVPTLRLDPNIPTNNGGSSLASFIGGF